MSSQSLSRKRPAPGATPLAHQQMPPLPNFPIPSQLSNEQFLQQWAPNTTSTGVNQPNPNSVAFTAGDDGSGLMSNQLTRRPGNNQIISRARMGDQNLVPMMDQNSLSTNDVSNSGTGETEEEMRQRALRVKKEAQAKRKHIPPFIQKLTRMRMSLRNLLYRSSSKHNNYASFVRQLNMYGFHKKVGLSDNSMRASERKNKSPSEYSNPYFKRGQPDLLWLIQKPKNVSGQGRGGSKGSRVKLEPDVDDAEGEEFGDEGGGGPSGAGGREDKARFRGQLALGSGEGTLHGDQLTDVYRELQAIRHQQHVISSTIQKLRRDHEQLYEQAANFQEQHTRHENSINAILTFLATVYNRSLQGHEGAQGLASSFAGAISQDHQGLSGNIVDVDELADSYESELTSNQPPFKKQRLLLGAPPTCDVQSGRNTMSPNVTNNPFVGHQRSSSGPHKASVQPVSEVEELFDPISPMNSTASAQQQQQRQGQPRQAQPQTQNQNQNQNPTHPHPKHQGSPGHLPQRDIMSLIQNSNARNNFSTNPSDFPTVLSSLETSGGNAPLTPAQRADMLRLISNENNAAHPSSGSSQNNALIAPHAPQMPSNYSAQLASTRSELDNLVKMQAEQARSVQHLTNMLQPLSPTGSIPGIDNNQIPPPPLDLDNIFNSGDYFSDIPGVENSGKDGQNQTHAAAAATAGGKNDNNNNNNATTTDSNQTDDLFDFDTLAADPSQPAPNFFDTFDHFDGTSNNGLNGLGDVGSGINMNSNNNSDNNNLGSGMGHDLDRNRITETFTSSEATSPANTLVDDSLNHSQNQNQAGDGSTAHIRSSPQIMQRRSARNQR
ncbi:heat shock transcription factor [Nannizzia gypsea CBS 118893]|uniref:Heat shock transcription factor n=1 Tax=Arthroderma gypseum (strain ATCC MYA-4604 / CBS 118893) TaxID=535722 RepID=E4UUV2_ARTGP|nr:heat shock transcription factor [Nannizzia gypsea CBS 118893]EFR01069.1 heat shock transcription factor [Nannizzia gypsea CBS 118893]